MEEMETSINNHIAEVKVKPKAKKYVSSLQQLNLLPQRKIQQLTQAVQITEGLIKGVNTTEILDLVEQKRTEVIKQEAVVEKKPAKLPKGETNRISLQLGKNIAEIATIRELAPSTIESHLVSFVKTGEVDVKELVPEDKIAAILRIVEELNLPTPASAPVKEKLGEDYSWIEVKAVLSYREWLQISKDTN
jgi:uncharacterized protein YpbB